jgi:hypothetical protein
MFASGRELPGPSIQWIVLGPVHYSTGLVKAFTSFFFFFFGTTLPSF